MAQARILLVEDDKSLARVIRDYWAMANFDVTACEDGVIALDIFKSRPFDICIVDVMLPKMDGYTLVEKIRAVNKTTPVIWARC